MAYDVPAQWVHGNVPTAALMQKYSDSLNAIHDITGDALVCVGSPHAIVGADHDYHVFVHKYRWLFFVGSGTLEDIADPTNNTQTLTEDGEPTVLDLNTVDWMHPGKIYAVEGSTWAIESRNP